MKVDELIRSNREKQSLTQAELAARSGTSQSTLSRYEAGQAIPTIATLERLLAACGSTLELQAQPSPRMLDIRTTRLNKLRSLRIPIHQLARREGISGVRVIGSVARGTDAADSDIDLLVDFDVYNKGLFPILDFQDAVAALLNEKVEVSVRQLLTPAVARTASRDEVPL